MHCNVPDEVIMLFYSNDLLRSVIVEHSELVIIGAHDYPLFAGNEFSTSHRGLSDFERSNLGLLVVIIDCDVSWVEADQDPR